MLDLEVLDTGLDIVFRIDPEHEAGLVETHLVFAAVSDRTKTSRLV